MSQALRRLSEQDLAQLYLHTQAPLRLDDLLQDRIPGEEGQIAVHDSISDQTPDLALVSLSLCGLIMARDYPVFFADGPMGPVMRELALAAEDNLKTVGRLWLNAAIYGIAPAGKADRAVIESVPDRLRILTSIFFELQESLQGQIGPMPAAARTLYYQSESHADLADKFVARIPKDPKPAAKKRSVPDQIPLPFDLDRPRQGAEVVTFNQFRKKNKQDA